MSYYTLLVLLLSLHVVLASCGTAGIVVGSIFGTLAVVAIVLGIIGFVYYKKKQKDKNKLKSNQEKLKPNHGQDRGHDNLTFVSDVETGTAISNNRVSPNINTDYAGYVQCREYESPVKNRQQVAARAPHNGPGPNSSLFLEEKIANMAIKSRPVQKTGSSGSLDNSYPTPDANIIVVPLLSHDIMGLGFNVDGNMKEGIYVSKLHKRGPAHDTGLIATGDRIMSVTVSFENMVLEDAMTILSYASPYPVKLCLKRGAPNVASKGTDSDEIVVSAVEAEDTDINHPVYRSQSLDDLRQISKDGLQHPRRTWSEWKKQGYVPNRSAGGGSLKKWKGKADIVEETSESGDLQDTQTPSSASNISIPDMKIDLNDLRMDSDDFERAQMHVAEVEMDAELQEIDLNLGKLEVDLERKDVDLRRADMGYDLDVNDVINAEVSDVTSSLPKAVDGEASISLNTQSVTFQNMGDDHKRPHEEDKDVAIVLDPNQLPKKLKLEDGELRRSSWGSSEDGQVNGGVEVSSNVFSLPTEKPPAIPSDTEDADDKDKTDSEEPTVGDVIRDYFGNSPTILHQFGLPTEETRNTTTEVTTMESDSGVTVTRKETIDSEDGVTQTTIVEKRTEMIAGSPDSGFLGTLAGVDNGVARISTSSSNSSPSSRSASPSRGDEGVEINKSSPLINRKAGGGLSFDISSLGFNDVGPEDEVKVEERTMMTEVNKGGPKGGVAYYYSIDDHGAPSHAVRPIAGADLDTIDLGQPELIRPKPSSQSTIMHSTTSVNSYDLNTDDLSPTTDLNDNSQPAVRDFKTSKLSVQLSGDEGVALSPDTNKDFKFEKTESVTIIRQTEVPEAFTVMVNREDSEA